MPGFHQIGPADRGAAEEIVGRAYEILSRMSTDDLSRFGSRAPDALGVLGASGETSDAVTRAAQDLGVVASREIHVTHAITSFAPFNEKPSSSDLIMCLTWGQFVHPALLEVLTQNRDVSQVFFGRRDAVTFLINPDIYRLSYSEWSIKYQQTAHTPGKTALEPHRWLRTTPRQVRKGRVPVGEIPKSRFPDKMWA